MSLRVEPSHPNDHQSPQHGNDRNDVHKMDDMHSKSPYPKFGLMLLVSLVVMYAVMYLHTYSWEHVRLSEMRFYMTFLMICAMAVTMLLMMWGMYKDKRTNYAILATAIIGFATVIYIERSQVFVQDSSWMSSMIPHHSIAILTSERADIDDVRVRKLADEIIEAQRREIAEMEWLLEDIKTNGEANTAAAAVGREAPGR